MENPTLDEFILDNQLKEIFPKLENFIINYPSTLNKCIYNSINQLKQEYSSVINSKEKKFPYSVFVKNIYRPHPKIKNCIDILSKNLSKKNHKRFKNLVKTIGKNGSVNSVASWNRYYWDSQIKKILSGDSFNLNTLEVDLTSFCDSNCFFCKEVQFLRENKKHWILPFDKTKEILLENKNQANFVIFSGGGDPTCYPFLKETLSLSQNLGYDIAISTHGGSIGTKRLPLNLFYDYPKILQFSIGAAKHKTYNYVHNKGRNFSRKQPKTVDYIFEQIKKIAKKRSTKNFLGVALPVPRIVVKMTVNPLNQNEIELMAQKCVDAGVDELAYRPVITTDPNLKKIKDAISQFKKIKMKYSNLSILTFEERIDYYTEKEDYFDECICHPIINPKGKGTKTPYGTVTSCLYRRGDRHSWLSGGEILNNSLENILNSQFYHKKIIEKNANLYSDNDKKCPRCRKVPNNIYLDILKNSSRLEKEILHLSMLTYFPETPLTKFYENYN